MNNHSPTIFTESNLPSCGVVDVGAMEINSSGALIDYTNQYMGQLIPEDHKAYCELSKWFFAQKAKLDTPRCIVCIVFSVTGFIGTILMCKIFSHHSFEGPSFIYHRAAALYEILHMIILFVAPTLELLGKPGDRSSEGEFFNVPWTWYIGCQTGWAFADMVKLTNSVIALLVSLERCVALWLPTKFHLINKKKIAVLGVCFSSLIGSLQLCMLGACIITTIILNVHGEWDSYFDAWFAIIWTPADFLFLTVIPPMRFSLGIVTLALSLIIVYGLKKKLIMQTNMVSISPEEITRMKNTCQLTLLLAIGTAVDNFAFMLWKIISSFNTAMLHSCENRMWALGGQMGPNEVYNCLMGISKWSMWSMPLWLMQHLTSVLVHCTRFYMYLLLHQRFRSVFKEMVSRNTTTVTPTSITSNTKYPSVSKM